MFKNIATIMMIAGLSFSALAQADYYNQTSSNTESKSGYSSSKETKSHFAKDTFATPADEQLNTKIRDKISKGLWDSNKDVALNTTNGIVTLVGTVNTKSDEEKLIAEVLKVEGVKSVRSKLEISHSAAY